ncbi:penicillin-binding protein 1A [Clostridium sp. Cult2]|uniref:penicillin-binding protein 1A n=1 Tax=Clostridium sp. Cult2 TaxID=2079003 RepID=UPI001EFFFF54|nr:PBP1A family penicillin-binding protein [Clostridium sp. Cult2]MCF6466477.1 transglycosylase [Clostridium sp. Cult2]
MSEENKKKSKPKWRKRLKIFFLVLFLLAIIAVGAISGVVIAIAKDAPKINPQNISSLLNQTSFILDQNGNVLEKIQTEEYRTIVGIDQMPQHLKDAFISIEDERFNEHIGVDPKGIIKSAIDNVKAGHIVRGASTITQQLAKNLYLTEDKKFDRKIKEAYLALQIEKALTKDQILEGYLNRIYLGQGAYGVQEAAQTYFSKDVENLTIAESAVLAGIIKSPTKYALYQTIKPEDFDGGKHIEVGQVDILGEKYIAVYNEEAINRQKIVLAKMLELEKITEEEYNTALNENILAKVKPGEKKIQGISSYFNDYIKVQVIEALMNELGYSREEAEEELYTGGLKIYSTMDLELQKILEDIYNNFTEVLLGNPENIKGPALISWRLNKAQNIIDERNRILFYKQGDILDENFNLIIEKDTYEITDGNLVIKNSKLNANKSNIDIADYYSIDERKNLVTHRMGTLSIPENEFSIGEDKSITISSKYMKDNTDFYSVDAEGNLLINEKYLYRQKDGIVQPQSGTVIMDYRTGEIKALVGGRDVEGNRILNRATSSARQPGSTIKPLAVYLPALDNGYTAASPIDDIPYYSNGQLWPNNWYTGYRGIYTLRRSVEQSVNVNSVKTVEAIGVSTSMEYLSRMGIINKENPSKDNFITSAENNVSNDENLSALGLGGMTKGLSPLDMTAAYGSIANSGTYIKPISFTKILDKDDNVLLENKPKETTVVSPQVAYIMSDILRTTVSNGIAGRAQIPNMPTAGKTGTTQDKADAWFVGYTPYYVTGLWIGNDSPQIKLNQGSAMAAQLWKIIMTRVHEGLEAKNFEQPDNIVSVNICTQSGKLPTELCNHDPRGSTIRKEIFVQGTQPTEFCDTHVELDIDTTTNKIANEYCPEDSVEKRVFIKREPPYNPEDHGGITPPDYQYTVPTEICDEHNQENWLSDWLNDLINNGNDEDDDIEDNDNGNGNNGNNNNNGNGDNGED